MRIGKVGAFEWIFGANSSKLTVNILPARIGIVIVALSPGKTKNFSLRAMKPRKKQRIDSQDAPNATEEHKKQKGKKDKKNDVVSEDVDNSPDSENGDEIIVEDEEKGIFEGRLHYFKR